MPSPESPQRLIPQILFRDHVKDRVACLGRPPDHGSTDHGSADPGVGDQAKSLAVSWTPCGNVANATGANSVPEPSASKNNVSPC